MSFIRIEKNKIHLILYSDITHVHSIVLFSALFMFFIKMLSHKKCFCHGILAKNNHPLLKALR